MRRARGASRHRGIWEEATKSLVLKFEPVETTGSFGLMVRKLAAATSLANGGCSGLRPTRNGRRNQLHLYLADCAADRSLDDGQLRAAVSLNVSAVSFRARGGHGLILGLVVSR